MADGLISQQTKKTIVLSRTISGLFLLIGVLAAGGALIATGGVYFYHQLLNRQNTTLKAEVQALADDIRGQSVNQQILELNDKLVSARTLLNNHTIPTNLFELLEADTLPRIRFDSFALNIGESRLDLGGEAASFAVIADQMRIFESSPSIKHVEFGGLTLGEKGLLKFRATIVFKPELLRWQKTQ